jgi:Zonular occludens toxin (Zot)
VGWRGHGKTMLAVERSRRLAKVRGVPLITNIYVRDEAPIVKDRGGVVDIVRAGLVVERIPMAPPGRKKGGDYAIDVEWLVDRLWRLKQADQGAVLLLDEMGVLFNSREWQKFPSDLGYLVAQGRRLRVDLIYTAQFIDQCDKTIRELTEVAHKVRAWPSPSILGRETGRRPWIMWTSTYRPAQVDQGEKRLGRAWRIYRRRRERDYDTDEFVLPARFAVLSSPSGPKARPEDRSPQSPDTHPEGRNAVEDGGAVACPVAEGHPASSAGTGEGRDSGPASAPAGPPGAGPRA